MPLTQQRLIDVVLAAQDYQSAFAELVRRVSLAHAEHPTDLRLQGLSILTAEDLLTRPHTSPTAIAVEIERIRFTRRANERRRRASQPPSLTTEEAASLLSDHKLSEFDQFTKKD